MKNQKNYLKENWKNSALYHLPSLFGLGIFISLAIEEMFMVIIISLLVYMLLVVNTLNNWYTAYRIKELEDKIKEWENIKY
jgi:hypothetical protein